MSRRRHPLRSTLSALAAAAVALTPGAVRSAEPASARIELDRDAGTLSVRIDGNEAFVYLYGEDLDLVHLYPVRSPGGKSMTVQHPAKYPHHRSFWFADKVRLEDKRTVEFYGALYSSEAGRNARKPPFRDRIRHLEFRSEEVDGNRAVLTAKLVWEMDRNVPVLDELREMRIVALGDGEYFLDITFTVTAAHGDVAFVSDAVHYAWPYIRMSQKFSVEGGGTITNSAGGVNQKGTNGQVATWVDYSNTVDGEAAGLAVFSHPDNPQPHQWLTRDYGTFGPRRIDQRSGKPFTLKKGESLAHRVGILVHRGNVKAGQVAERYRQYVGQGLP